MKSQSIFALLFLCILVFALTTTASPPPPCVDYIDPFDRSKTQLNDCPAVVEDETDVQNVESEIDNYIVVDLIHCASSKSLCKKIKNVFTDAGKELSKIFKFRKVINVNASVADLGDPTILGSAGVARSMLLRSDDNLLRSYPQALVKQFPLKKHPEYSRYDVIALFNSKMNWWFRSDNQTIKEDQSDLYAVILHEFIHGLGFVSSWDNVLEIVTFQPTTGITPDFYFTNNNEFAQFHETIFDRYVKFIKGRLVIPSNNYTAELNKAVPISYKDYFELAEKLKSSPHWEYAKLALTSATTNRGMIFMPANNTSYKKQIYLETSLDPFRAGSSVSHISDVEYDPTSDFLMTYQLSRGDALEDLIERSGKYKYPIGPRTISILESIGYSTEKSPNPPHIPKYDF